MSSKVGSVARMLIWSGICSQYLSRWSTQDATIALTGAFEGYSGVRARVAVLVSVMMGSVAATIKLKGRVVTRHDLQ